MNGERATNGCVAAVGTFDGFHLGHRAIIDRVLSESRAAGLPSCVITFGNHPLSVIAPDRAPGWAFPRLDSARLIADSGIDRIISLPFTPELQHLPAEDFMRYIKREYGVSTLVMGYDNTFGSDRLASPDAYAAAGHRAGIRVVNVPALTIADGCCPSSSALRKALTEGDIARYSALSGHFPILSGTVIHGKQNGRKIGIPTMNIDTAGLCLPAPGVYAAYYLTDDSGRLPAVLNIGTNPTVAAGNPLTVELHVPGIDLGDMYGHKISLEITRRIRAEQRFDSLDALRCAIAADIASLSQ